MPGNASGAYRSPSSTTPMPNFPSVDCKQPVRDIVARYPASESVFRHHGVDVARTGALSVEDAARAAGADHAVLCEVLRAAALVR